MKEKVFYKIFGSILAFSLIFTSCSSDEPEIDSEVDNPINIQLTRSEAAAVDAVNDFAFDLLKNTENRFGEKNHNYNVSPISAGWVISMLANGAPEGSETYKELVTALKFDQNTSLQDVNNFSKKLIEAVTKENVGGKVSIANALYHKKDVNVYPDFADKIKLFFDAETMADPTNQNLDQWISKKTEGNINGFAQKHNLEQYDFGLMNTLYFEGYWEKELNGTQPRTFNNYDGTTVKTLMMTIDNKHINLSEDQVCYLINHKFRNGYFAINFLVPKDGYKLYDVINHINGDRWRDLTETSESKLISLIVPKLDIKNDFDMMELMKDMGVTRIFNEKDTELTNITKDPIVIKCFDQANTFKLDETGAKAAVVTNAAGGLAANFVEKTIITLDEPFCYFITEVSTGAILFAGKVSHFY